ncbi:hypothetical protein HBH56_243810 [Parastagonospora nodorum]|uniref:Uncharacterized protein n=1 Tax=Phaeosphaeria nodorum (strain SN15 / ATCC MYA-4574 / FGSC 10173) TaxID=321614 RepID=A0A7U2HYV6_PHANO|nr:hypothetical protein HBH56_243810 [Parastagonospora nodorum]QRC96975.1 hypothetical protein JI435_409890 [Parastagonospora nodorum SN15]KAH3924092.1 hypothetical protein HBH54_198490 [Parastagonospora nodorum]KAH3944533.1 hypothetical protein HBH53_155000 [Parastagonospora nodorum]KAH3956576.1 hypothetical protein HBH51_239430 [Parastagonospora nodorum]
MLDESGKPIVQGWFDITRLAIQGFAWRGGKCISYRGIFRSSTRKCRPGFYLVESPIARRNTKAKATERVGYKYRTLVAIDISREDELDDVNHFRAMS